MSIQVCLWPFNFIFNVFILYFLYRPGPAIGLIDDANEQLASEWRI